MSPDAAPSEKGFSPPDRRLKVSTRFDRDSYISVRDEIDVFR